MTFVDTNAQQASQPRANGKHEPTVAELKARIAALEAEKEARSNSKLSFKIMDGITSQGEQGKGGIAVYGLGRFPTVLYAEQWERLLTQANVGEILTLCKNPRATRKAK